MFQNAMDHFNELLNRFSECLRDVIARNSHGFGQTRNQIATRNIHIQLFVALNGRTNVDFELFGGALANE